MEKKAEKVGDDIPVVQSRNHENLPLSCICLRNAFYESSNLFVKKEEMKKVAEELFNADDYLRNSLHFLSFGSLIDASLFGPSSPYIITNPAVFFSQA